MGLGAGAIKANVSPMIAEQYIGKMRKDVLKSGEVVIISPSVTTQSMYMWFYCGINFGSCGAISASFLARDNGYWAAYLVPTGIFAMVPLVLIIFKRKYIVTPPRGSILLETLRVLSLCLKPAFSWNPVQFYRNMKSEGFWNAAKPSHYTAEAMPSKITWDDEFVGEVFRTVHACGVFLFFPLFNLCTSLPPTSYSQCLSSLLLYRLLSNRRKLRNNGRRNDITRNTQRLDPKLKPHLHHHPHPHLRPPHLPRPPSSQNPIHTHQTDRFRLFRHFLRYGLCCCSAT